MKKRFWALFLAVMMIVSVLPTTALAADADVQEFDDEYAAARATNVTANKTVKDNGDGTYSIILSVTGDDVTTEQTTRLSADVFLVLDRSLSMDTRTNGVSRMEHAKTAAKEFVTDLTDQNISVSLIGFGRSASEVVSLTTNSETLIGEINKFRASDTSTNYTEALSLVQDKLPNNNHKKFVVFISDGEPGSNNNPRLNDKKYNGVEQANALIDGDVTILTVGIDVSGNMASALQAISSPKTGSSELHYYETAAAGLGSILGAISETIKKEVDAGTNAKMTDIVNDAAFEVKSAVGLRLSDDTVTWEIGDITSQSKTAEFVIQLNGDKVKPGEILTNDSVTLTFDSAKTGGKVAFTTEAIGAPKAEVYQVTYKPGSVPAFEEDVRYVLGEYALSNHYGSTPSYPGYEFTGWERTVVGYYITYTAQWEQIRYTIKWDTDGDGNVEDTTTVAYNEIPTHADGRKAADEQYTYTFTGWHPEIVPATGNATYTAQFQATANTYTVTFVDHDGTLLETETVEHGGAATAPDAPTREGYTFDGWDKEFDNITEDTTVTAQYEINTYTVTYTISGEEHTTQTYDFGAEITAPEYEVPEGYTFSGWDVPETMPAQNITVDATLTAKQTTITFDTQGGTEIAPITQAYGTAVTAPADPTKTGYTFAGWDKEIPATQPAEDMIITASWTAKQTTITFDTQGGTEIAPITQAYGTAVTAPADPTKTGYVFAGWDKEIPATQPAEDMIITASWDDDDQGKLEGGKETGDGIADKYQVFVWYKAGDNGSLEGKTYYAYDLRINGTTELRSTVSLNYPTPVARHGFDFDGWLEPADVVISEDTMSQFTVGETYVFTAMFSRDRGDRPVAEPTVKVKGLNSDDHVAYVVGRGEGMFDPMGKVTRAEVATIYFRLMTEEFRTEFWTDVNSFSDVVGTDWYNVAISTLENAGVIQDTVTGGEFRPNDPITRAELAVMAAQFATVTGKIPETSFKDVDKDYWAYDEIKLIECAGWIEGYRGYFRPDDNLTRAECVTIVNRMLKRGAEEDNMLEDMVIFLDNLDQDMWYYEAIQEAANSHDYTRTKVKLEGENFNGEIWTVLLDAPDWAALEQAWSQAHVE